MKSLVVAAALALCADTANMPTAFERLVSGHVDKMMEHGYASKIASSDLDHGHLIVSGKRLANKGCYSSIPELLTDVKMVLYHTDEALVKWNSEKGSPFEKKQRSIIGYMDGTITPAIDVIPLQERPTLPFYSGYGTVFYGDLAEVLKTYELPDACVNGKDTGLNFYIDKNKHISIGERAGKQMIAVPFHPMLLYGP